MDAAQLRKLYVALSENVRALDVARRTVGRDINCQLRRNDRPQIAIRTKLLALLYSAWSEAQFVQVIHTPHSFDVTEINKIKFEKDKLGIARGWMLMLELAVSRVGKPSTNKDLEKKLATLRSLVEKYVAAPALVRNKVAHGQWSVALNRGLTDKNDELTQEIAALDPVAIELQFTVHEKLALIVRDLVESPKKAFHRDYWTHYTQLEEFLRRRSGWTLETKRLKLARKPLVHQRIT